MADSAKHLLPYFNLPLTNTISCNLDSIWFFSQTLHLPTGYKTTISKKLILYRNWSILFFIFQFVLCICKASLDVLNQALLAMLLNTLYMIVSIIGILGVIYISMFPLLIYLMASLGISVAFLIISALAFAIGVEKSKAQAWWLYAPFAIDVMCLIFQMFLTVPIISWYAKVEKKLAEEEEDPVGEKESNGDFMLIFQNNAPKKRKPINKGHSNNEEFLDTELQSLKKASLKENTPLAEESINLSSENLMHDQEEISHLCVICSVSKKEGTFYPCGHVVCCKQCGDRFKGSACPICRKKVMDYVKLYNA